MPQGIAIQKMSSDLHSHTASERCPLCDQTIPNERLIEIQARISEREREQKDEIERRAKEAAAAEKAVYEAKARADIEQARKESLQAIEKTKADAAEKEIKIREETRKAVEADAAQRVTLADQARKTAEQQALEQRAALEKALSEAAAKEVAAREEARTLAEAAAAEKLAEVEKARKAAEQQAHEQRAALEKAQQDFIAKEVAVREQTRKATEDSLASKLAAASQAQKAAEERLQEQREALEKAKTDAVNAEKAKNFEDKLKLEEQLQKVQRQLQQKTAEELGEGAEVDLFEALKSEFPEDNITRVGRGAPGVDIIHRVMHNGKSCGCIVYDSKNRNQWRYEYVTKLRQDQLSEKADHAILSTQVFPSGAKQLHIQDGIIIANPARIIALVQMLHRHIVQTHGLRVSNEARQQKTDQLYEFITSDRCSQLLEQIDTLTDDMLDLDVKETKAHQTNWKRRGELIRSIQRAQGTFVAEVEGIIGTGKLS